MKALITGREGFVGQYLDKHLKDQGFTTYGFDLKHGQDLRNFEQVRNHIDKFKPDYIFHLAAQAYVPESMTNPTRAFEINTIGSLNILEAVRQVGINTKIHLAGTSEEYGAAEGILTEKTLPDPKSPYAISKLAMDYLGRWYASTYSMQVVVTRAFNHTGAGRGEMYAESSFAKQIAEIEAGKRTKVLHGNLESMRNYTDVRDMVRGYRLAIDLPSDVYNICTDQNYSMKDVLDMLISMAISPINTEEDPARMRKSDFSFAPPSANKFKIASHWQPEIQFEQTLESILNYWRGKV